MEKTFEELIDDKFGLQFEKSEKEEIKELLQQVREATKSEIMEKVIELNGQEYREPIKNIFDEFPTDRILTP